MMNEFEIAQMLGVALETINANFQFWLSGSFAVLLAFFFAGEKIVGYVKWTLIALYTASTVLFSLRLFIAGAQSQHFVQLLQDMNSDALLTPNINTFIGFLYAFIICTGTIATIYFGLNSKRIMS